LLLFLDHPDGLDAATAGALRALAREPVPIEPRLILSQGQAAAPPSIEGLTALLDVEGLARARYAAARGTTCLVRADQHLTGRWRSFEPDVVRQAARRMLKGLAPPVAGE
jgi:3-(3-hydroxy-phenyl)propionate hydroxylase